MISSTSDKERMLTMDTTAASQAPDPSRQDDIAQTASSSPSELSKQGALSAPNRQAEEDASKTVDGFAAEIRKQTDELAEYMAKTCNDLLQDSNNDLPEAPRSVRPLRKKVYERFAGSEVTGQIAKEIVALFNNHFAVWDESAAEKLGEFAEKGKHVLINTEQLKSRYFPPDADTRLVRVLADGEPAGFAASCHWSDSRDRKVMWVSLLIVHRDFRRRGIATGLVNELRDGGSEAEIYGIISPHPGACMALARSCGNTIRAIDHHFITHHTDALLASCPLEYIREAAPYGALFPQDHEGCSDHQHVCGSGGGPITAREDEYDGVMSTVFTNFYIDLTEVWSALNTLQAKRIRWPLGELPCGYEYILCFETRRR